MPKEALTSNIHHRPLHVVECPESDYETLKQLKFVENQLEKEKVNSAKLSKMVNDLNQHLSKFQTDFNSITYLHTIKEKELSETAKKFETL
jgi:predicted aldo/keto reductase-like oxidoreductase